MTPEERTEMYGHWSTAELALKARWKELQEAKLQNQELKAALLDLVYWSPNEEHFYPAIREGHIVDDIVGKLLGVSREPSKCGAILRGTPAFPDVACGAPMPCSVHTERLCELTREDGSPCRMDLPCPRHTMVIHAGQEKRVDEFHLTINKKDYKWNKPTITGAEIKKLAGSPAGWVVNEITDQPGEDPDVGDNQEARLLNKRRNFVTRNPIVSAGADDSKCPQCKTDGYCECQ